MLSIEAFKAILDIEAILARVVDETFALDGQHTTCTLTLDTGYAVAGDSVMHDEVFDSAAGRDVARLNAINHIWTLPDAEAAIAFAIA